MKKQMSLFVWAAAVFGIAPVLSADAAGYVSTRSPYAPTYTMPDASRGAYAPAKKSDAYRNMNSANYNANYRTQTRATTANTLDRKYYLAHPFFQPRAGKFGSVTDLAYNSNSYEIQTAFNLTAYPQLTGFDDTGKWDATQITIKEDFSYGITDELAIMGMARFLSADYKFDWANSPDDTSSESKIDMYGIGLQWRFADTDEVIATLSGYFQNQADIATYGVVDLKAGYKFGRTTAYGLMRGYYVNIDGDVYGNGIEDGDYALLLAYDTDSGTTFHFEGGVGVFSVLSPDWTLNGELMYGNYDWHNQASVRAAIGWQPGESFALNLYARATFYDSADDKHLDLYLKNPEAAIDLQTLTNVGKAKISDYSEMNIGVQAIFYF